MDRIVFKDYGTVQGKGGQMQHKVSFAYACDQKVQGRDAIVPNPYLKSYRVKTADGKVRISHADYLAEPVYQRLMRHVRTDRMEDSQWSGLVEAGVHAFIGRNGKPMIYVDLTEKAEKVGCITTPAQPFDEQAHDSFVKASLAEVSRQRVVAAEERLSQMTTEKKDMEYNI
ncbi:hypothetical protein ACI3DN_15865 [Sellimonas catena]|uniref:Uncharacterized protein n=1 Tax=Sellimonas catena TaxID=2994035 RepID=A0A9W6CBQ7_9FIRM|nr:hypothetical protein [Sellimonas catena]GLG06251.1 hypothetical protein Selli1_34250 [Sellimonas catena]GLG88855.1 hypothetical protein Selli2_02810 [Sellimonas catena]